MINKFRTWRTHPKHTKSHKSRNDKMVVIDRWWLICSADQRQHEKRIPRGMRSHSSRNAVEYPADCEQCCLHKRNHFIHWIVMPHTCALLFQRTAMKRWNIHFLTISELRDIIISTNRIGLWARVTFLYFHKVDSKPNKFMSIKIESKFRFKLNHNWT